MPAAKIFLTSADISAVMGISIRQAQYTLNMFDQRGQTVRNGRKKMVDLNIFSRFLSEQDGADLRERKRDIQEFLREAKKGGGRMTVVTADQVDRAENVTSALEEVLYHLHSAKEELEGSGSRTVEHISMIEEIISAAEEEKSRIRCDSRQSRCTGACGHES